MPPPDRDDPDEDAPTPRPAQRHSWPRGVPAFPPGPDDPPELDTGDVGSLYDEPIRPARRDLEAVHRAERDPGTPVMPTELSAVLRRLEWRIYQRVRGERQELVRTVDRLCVAIDGLPGQPGLAATVASHGQVVGPARSAASWALRGVVAAVLVIGAWLYHRGGAEQLVTDEIRRVDEKADRCLNQIWKQNSKDTKP